MNDPWSQYLIGKCHHLGRGEEKDKKTAAIWYQKAADQNVEKARQKIKEDMS